MLVKGPKATSCFAPTSPFLPFIAYQAISLDLVVIVNVYHPPLLRYISYTPIQGGYRILVRERCGSSISTKTLYIHVLAQRFIPSF